VWHGKDDQKNVRTFLAERLGDNCKPELVCRDPANGPRRLDGFVGLATPDQVSGEQPLAEARLFYDTGLLHLVAAGTSTLWAVWSEGSEPPLWFCNDGKPSPWFPKSDGYQPKLPTTHRDEKLLLRGKSQPGEVRSGLSEAAFSGKELSVRLYYEAGVLQWWRLTFGGKESAT
jgi:hypothetical protein